MEDKVFRQKEVVGENMYRRDINKYVGTST